VISPELVAEYRRLMSQTQDTLALYHQNEWVAGLQKWRDELTSAMPTVDLRKHAERKARALGGMESIGEIALSCQDSAFGELLDKLYATCRRIQNP
jgi:hypothetical protein